MFRTPEVNACSRNRPGDVSRSAKIASLLRVVWLFTVLLVGFGCSSTYSFYGVGSFNSNGVPEGQWTLYRPKGHPILGKGSFVNGEPHGNWTLWDEGGYKVAELPFANGKINGEYRFYFSSQAPQAKNRLKTVGHQVMGQSLGEFERYLPDGKSLVKYRLMEGMKYDVIFGSWRDVAVQSEADKELLRIDEGAIRSAVRNRAP